MKFLPLLLLLGSQIYSASIPPNLSAYELLSLRSLALGQPQFTNTRLYNAYDHNNSPLGLIERDSIQLKFLTGMLSSEISADSGSHQLNSGNLYLPALTLGLPGMFIFNIHHRKIGEEVEDVNNKSSLNVNDVGMEMAFGPRSQIFQMGFALDGLWGQAADNNNNKRTLIQINNLGLHIGSQFHSMTRFGGYINTSAWFDSLISIGSGVFERRFGFQIPGYGFHTDIGDTSIFPLLVNASLDFSTDRFKGTYKSGGNETDYNPRITNAYNFSFKSMYFLNVQDYTYSPAITFGKWGNSTQRYAPGSGKRDPLSIGAECASGSPCGLTPSEGLAHSWDYSGYQFGLGGNLLAMGYISIYSEWQLNTLSWDIYNDNHFEAYNRYLFAAEGSLHNIPQLRFPEQIKAFVRTSVASGSDNANINYFRPYQFQYFSRYTLHNMSLLQKEVLTPSYGDDWNWTTLNFGLGAELKIGIGTLGADFYTGFFFLEKAGKEYSGLEIGTVARLQI